MPELFPTDFFTIEDARALTGGPNGETAVYARF